MPNSEPHNTSSPFGVKDGCARGLMGLVVNGYGLHSCLGDIHMNISQWHFVLGLQICLKRSKMDRKWLARAPTQCVHARIHIHCAWPSDGHVDRDLGSLKANTAIKMEGRNNMGWGSGPITCRTTTPTVLSHWVGDAKVPSCLLFVARNRTCNLG